MLSGVEASRIEQQTLKLSIGGVLAIAIGSIGYGLLIDSEAVI